MHVPTLPLTSNFHIYIEGDVSINSSAVIAQGVILQAAPDSKIIIAAGVSIGMGSILHAQGGTLEVEASANLGAGVLIVGKGKIGKNACIGSVTTIWNHSVEPWQVVPAASILGDKGRQVAGISDDEVSPSTSPSSANLPEPTSAFTSTTAQESLNGQVSSPSEVAPQDRTDKESISNSNSEAESIQTEPSQPESSPEASPQAASPTTEDKKPVSGQGSLDQLLKTLFPYNQSLNPPSQDSQG
ncbi:MAG: transferase [Symploca sp. SIO2G7]|nr:transferase [Symploca sp. SIO2G7]